MFQVFPRFYYVVYFLAPFFGSGLGIVDFVLFDVAPVLGVGDFFVVVVIVKRSKTPPVAVRVVVVFVVVVESSADALGFRLDAVEVFVAAVAPLGVAALVVVDVVFVVDGVVRFLTSLFDRGVVGAVRVAFIVVRGAVVVDRGAVVVVDRGTVSRRVVVVVVVLFLGVAPPLTVDRVVVVDLRVDDRVVPPTLVVVVFVVVEPARVVDVVFDVPYNREYTSPDRSRVIFGCEGVRTIGVPSGASEVRFFVVVVVVVTP